MVLHWIAIVWERRSPDKSPLLQNGRAISKHLEENEMEQKKSRCRGFKSRRGHFLLVKNLTKTNLKLFMKEKQVFHPESYP